MDRRALIGAVGAKTSLEHQFITAQNRKEAVSLVTERISISAKDIPKKLD
jgi:hypothetical protein